MRNYVTLRQTLLAIVPALTLAMGMPHAQAKTHKTHKTDKQVPVASGHLVDGIAAIVNTEVITMRQLQERIAANRMEGGPQDPEQVLQDMIDEKLIQDEGKRMGAEISDAQVMDTIREIAQRSNLTPEQLRQEADRRHINWDDYVKGLHDQILMRELRNHVLQSRINITSADIDAYLKQNPTGVSPEFAKQLQQAHAAPPERRVVVERSFEPKAIAFKHIYIRVPDDSSQEVIDAARKKANKALAEIRSGHSFESVAREYSDAPDASSGGDLGIRMFEDWPKLFVSATKNVKDGGVSGVFQAANGFHILKVVERRGVIHEAQREVEVQAPQVQAQEDPRIKAAMQQGPVNVTETHARHILIRVTPVVNAEQAYQKIQEVQKAMQNGMSFSEAAAKYSQDSSAPLGGDLGWVIPGVADPRFQQAMDQLQVGQISQPVQSAFGWHIIEVLGRRTEDKQPQIRRSLAADAIYQERAKAVLEDWIGQLRARTYVDNRLTGNVNSK